MRTDISTRFQRLEVLAGGPPCRRCWGTGSVIVAVPAGADPDAPAYRPEACPGCGQPVRNVLRIIGMNEGELG